MYIAGSILHCYYCLYLINGTVESHLYTCQVVQRRTHGQQDFNQTWTVYEQGFGSPSQEFWIGTITPFLINTTLYVEPCGNTSNSLLQLKKFNAQNMQFSKTLFGSILNSGIIIYITELHSQLITLLQIGQQVSGKEDIFTA